MRLRCIPDVLQMLLFDDRETSRSIAKHREHVPRCIAQASNVNMVLSFDSLGLYREVSLRLPFIKVRGSLFTSAVHISPYKSDSP